MVAVDGVDTARSSEHMDASNKGASMLLYTAEGTDCLLISGRHGSQDLSAAAAATDFDTVAGMTDSSCCCCCCHHRRHCCCCYRLTWIPRTWRWMIA